jgi:ornithine--oxo-acid transaminase
MFDWASRLNLKRGVVVMDKNAQGIMEQTHLWGANNYKPLEVVLEKGEGSWVYDVEGKKYLDMISAYSALSHGHRHPRILASMINQLDKITLTSRAVHNDRLGDFLEKLCTVSGFDKALPMNTGAEAVETALKLVRKWGVVNKGVPDGKQEIVVCSNNFNGRTISIISFSTVDQYKYGFGPLTQGFVTIPFGDSQALESVINDHTVAFIVEPIQGEGGIVVPPDGYLKEVREITKKHGVLLVADEIQTGLARTGKLFAYQWEDITPDVLILGKSLGGGVYPVSAVLANNEVMGVFCPGDHGSTFGGNPLASAVAYEALCVIMEEDLAKRALESGNRIKESLLGIQSPYIKEVRGKGLLIGIEIKKEYGNARTFIERLISLGVLCNDTKSSVIRVAPPLNVKPDELDYAISQFEKVFV